MRQLHDENQRIVRKNSIEVNFKTKLVLMQAYPVKSFNSWLWMQDT